MSLLIIRVSDIYTDVESDPLIAHGQWQKCINNAQLSSGADMPPPLKIDKEIK